MTGGASAAGPCCYALPKLTGWLAQLDRAKGEYMKQSGVESRGTTTPRQKRQVLSREELYAWGYNPM